MSNNFESNWWLQSTDTEIVEHAFKINKRDMPFEILHRALETVLKRGILPTEFEYWSNLKNEYNSIKKYEKKDIKPYKSDNIKTILPNILDHFIIYFALLAMAVYTLKPPTDWGGASNGEIFNAKFLIYLIANIFIIILISDDIPKIYKLYSNFIYTMTKRYKILLLGIITISEVLIVMFMKQIIYSCFFIIVNGINGYHAPSLFITIIFSVLLVGIILLIIMEYNLVESMNGKAIHKFFIKVEERLNER